ncbi:MAG: hypothetical protein DRP18_03610 [Candidatus Aenigmatarchaeota archaeon]|nr:MAG: hypothetical protein DRP18_03610 [Candidatus Aenigmarchaeota archaeon]
MKTNVFYLGDCLDVMNYDIPAESIDLIYLDPPFFGTGVQKGEIDWSPGKMQISYDDSKKFWSRQEIRDNAPLWLKGIAMKKPDSHWKPLAKYLYYMMERLEACKRVLKPTGSIYLHCDRKASSYLKIVMDEVFGYDKHRSSIVWNTSVPEVAGFKWLSNNWIYSQAVIHYYTKSKRGFTFNKEYVKVKQKSGDISKKPVTDIWNDIKNFAGYLGAKDIKTGYPTQKPEALLERIIKASSNEGDIVLDPFCGCGTTIVVAHRLNRKWIGIDINEMAMKVIKQRINRMGLTQGKLDLKIEYPSFRITHKTLMKLTGKEFEEWVNKICNAKKPSYDRGVDGIMEDGTPIQTKTNKVGYDVVGRLLIDAESHSEVPKPVKKIRVVSREGFDESAWEKKSWIELNKGVKVELLTPEDLLGKD